MAAQLDGLRLIKDAVIRNILTAPGHYAPTALLIGLMTLTQPIRSMSRCYSMANLVKSNAKRVDLTITTEL